MHIPPILSQLWPILLIVMLASVAKALLQKKSGASREMPTARRPLTEREQSMYMRMVQALPDHIILAQVSFSALLDAQTKPARNHFSQKTADFVVLDKAFNVVAEVELDDSSHNGREEHDARRDDILKQAGYKVIRFTSVPTINTIQSALIPSKHPARAGS
jgi:very-short-patch-repair endonuclease